MSTATTGRTREYRVRDEMIAEEWAGVPGFHGYEASSEGRVRRTVRNPALLTQHINFHGYPSVQVWCDGWSKKVPVHALVALAFLGERPPGQEVCHNNADRVDNRLSNLRYDTHAGNMADIVRDRTHCKWGHEFTPKNTYVLPKGGRSCRACNNARNRAFRAKKAVSQ